MASRLRPCEHAFVTSQASRTAASPALPSNATSGRRDVPPRARHTKPRSGARVSGLLAEQRPEKLQRACVRWHGRVETEAVIMTLAESQLALAALASLCAGEREAVVILRRLLRRVTSSGCAAHWPRP